MKNFLFDLYGTLIDIRTDEWSDAFWKKIAEMLGTADPARARERYQALCKETPLPEGGEIDLTGVMRRLLEEFGVHQDALTFARAFRAASMQKLKLFDGVPELLCGLKQRGAKCYLLSNAQACFTHDELKKLGLADKFDGILLSSEVGWKKPSPRFFTAAFEKFSLQAETCIYVGNDLHDDVMGARRVGLRSVYIETEQSGTYADPIPVDLFAKSHAELKTLLFSLAENETTVLPK